MCSIAASRFLFIIYVIARFVAVVSKKTIIMKKYLLLLSTLLMSVFSLSAQNCTLTMTSGQTLQGTLIDASDSTVTFLIEGAAQALTIPASRIKSGRLPHKGKIYVQEGKVLIQTGDDIKAAERHEIVGNPNYALGKAMKVSGVTSLCVGVPCLSAGLATCIAGHVSYVSKYGTGLTTKSQLLEASYYLLPIGASLTIVGIPLYVEGKKIMDLNVSYTGNGVGLTMNF